jgi:quercetin dioxygenase-like cupin family protein
LHLFDLGDMIRAMRTEHVYQANGHTGLLLLKSDHLRVVLGVAASGSEISEHAVHGPTVMHVISGALELHSAEATCAVRAGELVVIPHDRSRKLRATADTTFLWALSVEGTDGIG